jgi:hypothetical protein
VAHPANGHRSSFLAGSGRGAKLTTHLHLVLRLRMWRATPPLPHTMHCVMLSYEPETTLSLPYYYYHYHYHSLSAWCVIATNDMRIFGHFRQKHSPLRTPFGNEIVFKLTICTSISLVLFSLVFYCYLFFVFILSSCADSVIGSCNCRVSTLK